MSGRRGGKGNADAGAGMGGLGTYSAEIGHLQSLQVLHIYLLLQIDFLRSARYLTNVIHHPVRHPKTPNLGAKLLYRNFNW